MILSCIPYACWSDGKGVTGKVATGGACSDASIYYTVYGFIVCQCFSDQGQPCWAPEVYDCMIVHVFIVAHTKAYACCVRFLIVVHGLLHSEVQGTEQYGTVGVPAGVSLIFIAARGMPPLVRDRLHTPH